MSGRKLKSLTLCYGDLLAFADSQLTLRITAISVAFSASTTLWFFLVATDLFQDVSTRTFTKHPHTDVPEHPYFLPLASYTLDGGR